VNTAHAPVGTNAAIRTPWYHRKLKILHLSSLIQLSHIPRQIKLTLPTGHKNTIKSTIQAKKKI